MSRTSQTPPASEREITMGKFALAMAFMPVLGVPLSQIFC
jgi:hypothetical protein